MKYLLMCCFDETQWEQLPDNTQNQIMQDYGELIQALVKSGHYQAGAKLHGSATATTLRGKDGRVSIVDGPFAETKEQLGGYHLVECKDLDEALSIARRIPTLPYGGVVEVRPLMEEQACA
jgi:hypothetical protein